MKCGMKKEKNKPSRCLSEGVRFDKTMKGPPFNRRLDHTMATYFSAPI
jgi:hypothetical protein